MDRGGIGILVCISLLCLLVILSGCAGPQWATASTKDRSGTFCDSARPMYLSARALAAMNAADLRQVVGHNEFGERNCGWKPSRR